jgi:hypothetical protein
LSQRPSKIVRTSIKDVGESVLHTNDLKSVSKAIYRVRRKSQPNLPKSREDVHTVLENYPVVTNKSETFLQVKVKMIIIIYKYKEAQVYLILC